ncbi:MAG: RecX family transcriptional regulator [Bacteroidetes bacterium]|nr:MAG: RecX family transcriptional regulator [Bacteroidota bacterium]
MAENALFRTALNKAMALCSRREYCIHDIGEKIESWGIGENDIKKIISILIQENFLNEERFARAFVKDKFNYNKWGKIKITLHLRSKNIPGDIIRKALDSIDKELYIRTLRDLISGHRRFVKAKNQYDLKAKLLRFGLSKGFESSLIYDLLNDTED